MYDINNLCEINDDFWYKWSETALNTFNLKFYFLKKTYKVENFAFYSILSWKCWNSESSNYINSFWHLWYRYIFIDIYFICFVLFLIFESSISSNMSIYLDMFHKYRCFFILLFFGFIVAYRYFHVLTFQYIDTTTLYQLFNILIFCY